MKKLIVVTFAAGMLTASPVLADTCGTYPGDGDTCGDRQYGGEAQAEGPTAPSPETPGEPDDGGHGGHGHGGHGHGGHGHGGHGGHGHGGKR